jgi:hypothetical protein
MSILPYTEKTLIEINQAYLVEVSSKTPKNQILNHLPSHGRMGQKTISPYCPFKQCQTLLGHIAEANQINPDNGPTWTLRTRDFILHAFEV